MTPAQRTGAILAGLRLLQTVRDNRPFVSQNAIDDILTNAGAHEAPSSQEIDTLCVELNTQRNTTRIAVTFLVADADDVAAGAYLDGSLAYMCEVSDDQRRIVSYRIRDVEGSQEWDEWDEYTHGRDEPTGEA
jgi:hypothetical protein